MAKLKSFSANYNNSNLYLGFSDVGDGLSIASITGANGSSKSSILRDIVICALQKNEARNQVQKNIFPDASEFNSDYSDVIFAGSEDIHIIATSGSPFDRFPERFKGGYLTTFNSPNYIYLGQRIGSNLLSKRPLVEFIVIQLLKNHQTFRELSWIGYIFKKTGLVPRIYIDIRPKMPQRQKTKRRQDLLSSINDALSFQKKTKEIPYLLRRLTIESIKNLQNDYNYDAFLDLELLLEGKKNVGFSLPLDNAIMSDVNIDSLVLGLTCGSLEIFDCKVVGYKNSTAYSIYELSSGEYHMLTSLLGVYLSAKPGSIVLMDEPENSLHPAWQSMFVDVLIKTCRLTKTDQLIIGTHSPIIVASLPKESDVIELSSTEVNGNFFGKTVEEILLENFKLPTTRNYYFYEELQNAIRNFANNGQINESFEHSIKNLIQYRKNLRSTDPAAEIIDFLWGEYISKK